MVAMKLPTVAVALALQVITLVVVVTGFVPKVQVTPDGRPETARATLPVKPPTSVTVMVSVAVLPCVMERGGTVSVKVDLVVTVRAMVVVSTSVPELPVMVTL